MTKHQEVIYQNLQFLPIYELKVNIFIKGQQLYMKQVCKQKLS